MSKFSGAGTNLKVGALAGKKRLVVPLHFFGSKSTISRFGEWFRDGQYTVWSVYCLLLFYSRCMLSPVSSHL